METKGAKHKKNHVLLPKKNIYGLNQDSANLYDMLEEGLQIRGFHESVADPCVFLKGSNDKTASSLRSRSKCTFAGSGHPLKGPACTLMEGGNTIIDHFRKDNADIIVLVYVDYCIILSRNRDTITKFISALTFGPERFEFTDEGELSKYLGVEIDQLKSLGFL